MSESEENMNTVTTMTTELALQGVVQPGRIAYNVEDIKEQALQIKETYEKMQYAASSAEQRNKDMKNDRAMLNKAATNAKKKLSEVKEAYMGPFSEFETGIKEAIASIDDAKNVLDKKVKEFEEAARAEKKAQITDYYDKSFNAAGIDPDVKNIIFTIIYDPKWENATSTKKAYEEGIGRGLSKYEDGMKALSSDSYKDYHDEAVKVFLQNLDLAAALAEVEALKKRDEEIIRREKERLEAEARKKAEAELLEAKKRAEEAERAAKEAQMQAEMAKTTVNTTANTVPTPDITPAPVPKAPEAGPTISSPEKVKLAIQIIGGAVVGVYSDSKFEIALTILDEDLADMKERADFAKLTAGMKQLY